MSCIVYLTCTILVPICVLHVCVYIAWGVQLKSVALGMHVVAIDLLPFFDISCIVYSFKTCPVSAHVAIQ